MAALTAWVKSLVLIVLFATFFELLLPNNSLNRFIKVIMGLFIMLAVLNPITSLLKQPWHETEVAALGQEKMNVPSNLSADSLEKLQAQLAMAEYKRELAQQITVIAQAVEGVQEARTTVVVEEDRKQKDYRAIKEIKIYVRCGERGTGETVARVRIGEQGTENKSQFPPNAQTVAKIQSAVGEFYHIKADAITVQGWMEEEGGKSHAKPK